MGRLLRGLWRRMPVRRKALRRIPPRKSLIPAPVPQMHRIIRCRVSMRSRRMMRQMEAAPGRERAARWLWIPLPGMERGAAPDRRRRPAVMLPGPPLPALTRTKVQVSVHRGRQRAVKQEVRRTKRPEAWPLRPPREWTAPPRMRMMEAAVRFLAPLLPGSLEHPVPPGAERVFRSG